MVRRSAGAGRLFYSPKAQVELQGPPEELDAEDVASLLCDVADAAIVKYEGDRDRPGRMVLILRVSMGAWDAYCKISLRPDVDHDTVVLSFHRWSP